jgi:hypothetical protein
VLPPSGATISGFWRFSASGKRLPWSSNKIGVLPIEELGLIIGSSAPNAGVSW